MALKEKESILRLNFMKMKEKKNIKTKQITDNCQ